MTRRRRFGFSFSWKRALGLSAAKGRLSRVIGIPLTKQGRQRKLGGLFLGRGCVLLIAVVSSAVGVVAGVGWLLLT